MKSQSGLDIDREFFNAPDVHVLDVQLQAVLAEERAYDAQRYVQSLQSRRPDVLRVRMQRRLAVVGLAVGSVVLSPWLLPDENDSAAKQTEFVVITADIPLINVNELAADTVDNSTMEREDVKEKITIQWLPQTVMHHKQDIEATAKQFDIDANYIAILMTIESSGHPLAVSVNGAQGLMQVMPGIQTSLMNNYNLPKASMFEVKPNLLYAGTLLRELFDKYERRTEDKMQVLLAAAADYNGGPGQANFILRGEKPSIGQTRDYAMFVEGMWQERHDPQSPMLELWKTNYGGQGQIDRAAAYLGV